MITHKKDIRSVELRTIIQLIFGKMLQKVIFVALLFHISNAKITIDYEQWDCSTSSSYSSGSDFETNLNTLLSTLVSNISNSLNGFSDYTSGKGSVDHVYGLTLCRGDVSLDKCQACVRNATQDVLTNCPLTKEAVIWKEECMLQYTYNTSITSSTLQHQPDMVLHNIQNVSDPTRWTLFLGDMLSNITNMAAVGVSSGRKYATMAEWNSPMETNVYTLAQCVPGLSVADCMDCFNGAKVNLPLEDQGGIALTPSCALRYEIYPFYDKLLVESPPSTRTPPANNGNTSGGGTGTGSSPALKIGLGILGLVLLVSLATGAACLLCRRKKRFQKVKDVYSDSPSRGRNISINIDGGEEMVESSLKYELATLEIATNNFSDENKLGEGGFGSVYKGILSNGKEIAVKRLSKGAHQGLEQFTNELFIAKLQQKNLVSLLGFCRTTDEMLLVYEYIPNLSLDVILFDPKTRGQLDWPIRYKIINGIARGMSYLHEFSALKIVHRDLKASNILLEADMNQKISDFGLAKNMNMSQEHGCTSRVFGTMGYMAPEYIEYGEFSTKSDVYSFGVLVLEIVNGQKISKIGPETHLLTHAWKCCSEGTLSEFVDQSIRQSCSISEVQRCIHIGLLCVQGDPEDTPSMIKIVSYLHSNEELPTPTSACILHVC